MDRSGKIALGCLAAGFAVIAPIVLFLAIWQFLAPDRPPVTQVAFSDFMAQVHADPSLEPHVEAASIKGREITFWVKDPKSNSKTKRATLGPQNTGELAREMTGLHIAVSFEQEDPAPPWPSLILAALLLGAAVVVAYSLQKLASARQDLARATAEVARLQALLEPKEPWQEIPTAAPDQSVPR